LLARDTVGDEERSSQRNPLRSSTSRIGPSTMMHQLISPFVLQEWMDLLYGEAPIQLEVRRVTTKVADRQRSSPNEVVTPVDTR
jgi:hypothetical protein